MTCQRFKTDSCLCTGPAKLRGGTDALLLLRRRSPLPARLDGSPLLSVNPPSPDRGLAQIVTVNVTQEFGVCGVRTAAFRESSLEVAGWGKAGTLLALLLCWPLRRLPPMPYFAFFAFFFLRFFFLRDVLQLFCGFFFLFCESLRRQMHFLRISHDRRGLLLRLLLLLFLLGLGLLRLLRLLRRLLGGLLRLHVLWVEQNRLLPTRLRHVGLSKTRFLFTT